MPIMGDTGGLEGDCRKSLADNTIRDAKCLGGGKRGKTQD